MNFIIWDSMQDSDWDNFSLSAGVSAVTRVSFNQAHPRWSLDNMQHSVTMLTYSCFLATTLMCPVHLVQELCCVSDERDNLYSCIYVHWFLPDQLSEEIKSTIALTVRSTQLAGRWQIAKRITAGCGNRKLRKCFSQYCHRTCHATEK